MDQVSEVALVVACGTAVSAVVTALSPYLLARFTDKQRRRDRAEDKLDRQEVADKVDRAARAARDVAKAAADSASETRSQLRQIHTLVNSDMTAARQAELDQTVASTVLMRELIALKKLGGHEPSPDALAALKTNEERIAELRLILADRMEQMKAVENEILEAKEAKEAKEA